MPNHPRHHTSLIAPLVCRNVGFENKMIRPAVQFVAVLVAAMLGEYIVCRLLRFPSMSQPRFWVAAVFWSAATLGYLIPRDLTPSLRTRILGGFLVVAALGVARAWFAWQICFPVGLRLIVAPLPALIVFYIASVVTATPRSPGSLVTVLLPGLAVQFLAMWWSYGFKQDLALDMAAPQVIPFFAATVTLLVTDNLIKTGDNPTRQMEDIVA